MDIDNARIAEILLPHLDWFKLLAQEFAKSRFLVNASEYGMNDKESEELMKIADGINISLSSGGSSLQLEITYGESPYLNIIENGMSAPLAGGDNGVVTNPDGSQEPSEVPEPLWGNPIDSYAKEGEDVMGEVKEMLTSLFRDAVVQAAGEARPEIIETIRPELVRHVQQSIGGAA